jgi:AcrR family transcriptional regulator
MEVKDRIKQKAEELFRRLGIRSVTMDEIAGQLGISKKTIYLYYADKDEIVDAVISDILAENQEACNHDRSVATNAIHEVFLMMEMIKETFEDMNPSVLYDLERNHPGAFQKFLQHKHNYIYKAMKDNLARGIKEELYRKELNIEIIAKLRLETMMISFNQEVFPKAKYNLLEVEQQVIEHYLYGIASLKGHKLILKYQQEKKV